MMIKYFLKFSFLAKIYFFCFKGFRLSKNPIIQYVVLSFNFEYLIFLLILR